MFNKNQDVTHAGKIETIIGPSVRVEGDFKGEGDLVIEGMLIGNLQTKNNLKIGQNAIVEAEVRANNAFVSGKVKGNISVKGKIEITATAVILGDIKAQVISIESGALVQGKLNMPTRDIKEEAKEVPVEEVNSEEEQNQ
ncbi:MAG: Integral membrane protein CcmA involved in cell shape determination [Parcubacteria group bacterium GW2011_GWA2_36_10]|nr:MAG: Integral membrane protein CcmA involved in cell shape determination [Parcubacteria group bacterium GW2011_GWA2_36_10]